MGLRLPAPGVYFSEEPQILEEILVDCTEEEKAKITCHNAERIYRL